MNNFLKQDLERSNCNVKHASVSKSSCQTLSSLSRQMSTRSKVQFRKLRTIYSFIPSPPESAESGPIVHWRLMPKT